MRLKDKIAIVTGGSRGIGEAISHLFAKEGATVYIWDLLEEGAIVAEQIQEKGGKASFTKISITDQPAIEAEMAKIHAEHGRIDILINNAGIQTNAPSHELETADFDKVIRVNLRGSYLCAREAIKHFLPITVS